MTPSRRHRFAVCFVLTCFLMGCGPEPKAPEPTVNPHPHEFSKLKITVEPGSGVNNVKVESIWAIGNIGCAPNRGWPSGSSIQKEIHTKETVEKIDSDNYVATIIEDRFAQDTCHWRIGGLDVRYVQGNRLVGIGGGGWSDYEETNPLKLTCASSDKPPVCWPRSKEWFLRAKFKGVFNVSEELEK